MKNFLIIALSAATVYLLYTAYKKKEEKTEAPVIPPTKEPSFACPEGEILCDKKENTCYNPSAKYIVDPCL
jgi:hypothetical protein